MKILIILATGFLQCLPYQRIKTENIAFRNEELLNRRLLAHHVRAKLQEIQKDYVDVSSEDELSRSASDNIKTTGISIPLEDVHILPQKQYSTLRVFSTVDTPPVLRALRKFRVERVKALPKSIHQKLTARNNFIMKKPQATSTSEKLEENDSHLNASNTALNYRGIQGHMKDLRNQYNELQSMWEQKLIKIRLLKDEVDGRRIAGEKNIRKLTDAVHRSPKKVLTSSKRSEESISIDPKFLDLDDVQKFSDISSIGLDNTLNNKTTRLFLSTSLPITSTVPTINRHTSTARSTSTKSSTRRNEQHIKVSTTQATFEKTKKLLNSTTTIFPRTLVMTVKRSSTTSSPFKSTIVPTSVANTKLEATTPSRKVDILKLPISKGQEMYKQIRTHTQRSTEKLKPREMVSINNNSSTKLATTSRSINFTPKKLDDASSTTLPPIVLDFTTEATKIHKTTQRRFITQTTTKQFLYTTNLPMSKTKQHQTLVNHPEPNRTQQFQSRTDCNKNNSSVSSKQQCNYTKTAQEMKEQPMMGREYREYFQSALLNASIKNRQEIAIDDKAMQKKVQDNLLTLATSLNMKELSQSLRQEFHSDIDTDLEELNLEEAYKEMEKKKAILHQLKILSPFISNELELKKLIDKHKQYLVKRKSIRGTKTRTASAEAPTMMLTTTSLTKAPESTVPADILELENALSEIRFFEISENENNEDELPEMTNLSPNAVIQLEGGRETMESQRSRRMKTRIRGHSLKKDSLKSPQHLKRSLLQDVEFQIPGLPSHNISPNPKMKESYLASNHKLTVPETHDHRSSSKMIGFCEQFACNFENGDLCNFETSHDELTKMAKIQRVKRQVRTPPLTLRSWSNWIGHPSDSLPMFDKPYPFSKTTHFAAIFLEAHQIGTLTIKVPTISSFRIRFHAWEATRGMQLRVCCNEFCPFSTEIGVKRGHKQWLKHTVECPAGTQQLTFECINRGLKEGICGLDDIFVDHKNCFKMFDGPDDV